MPASTGEKTQEQDDVLRQSSGRSPSGTGQRLTSNGDMDSSVVNALVASGVENTRLSAEGYGPDQPIASNATEDGRAQNRRVEVFIRPPAM